MNLESNKTLGGVGAILVAIGSLSPFSGYISILGFVGIILVLIAMKGLAEYYNEKGIFQNALYGFIFGIVGIIVTIVVFVVFFAAFPMQIIQGFNIPPTQVMMVPPPTDVGILIAGLIIGLIALVVFLILEAIFYRKAFNLLAEKSGEKMFYTAGLLLLIGAILTIIIIGAILLLIAWILAAVAFLKTEENQLMTLPPPPPP